MEVLTRVLCVLICFQVLLSERLVKCNESGSGQGGSTPASTTPPSSGGSTESGVSTQQTGSSTSPSTDSSSASPANPSSQSSPTSGTNETGKTTEAKPTSPDSSDKKVVVDGSEVDNGCGCTWKNVLYGFLSLGIYNCYKHHKYKSESKSENEFTSDCSDKTAVTLDIKNNKNSTNEYDYNKTGNVTTYTAKDNFVFNKITQSITIWEAKNSNKYATKVELRGTTTLILYFGDGNENITFKKKDYNVQVKWEEVETQTGTTGTGGQPTSGGGANQTGTTPASGTTGTGQTGTTGTGGTQPNSGGGTTGTGLDGNDQDGTSGGGTPGE